MSSIQPLLNLILILLIAVFRNHIPWAILSACWFATMVLILVLRWYLARQNAKRETESHDATYDEVYIEKDGEKAVKVDKVSFFRPSRFSVLGNSHFYLSCIGLPGSHRLPKSRLPLRSLIGSSITPTPSRTIKHSCAAPITFLSSILPESSTSAMITIFLSTACRFVIL